MRIALAEIAQETDSFSPLTADLKDFESYGLYFGPEILERMPGVGPLGGFLEVAAGEKDVTLLPVIRAFGSAGGTITAETFEFLVAKLVEGLKLSLPLDAVFLSLHGAAASAKEDDVEGALLQAARNVIGNTIPIVVAFDHHANITQRMVDCANALVGHETQPHDPPATGRKAAKILFRMLKGEIQPTVCWRKIPMITPQDQFLTSEGPMKEWFDLARQMEQSKGVLDVSPYPMQPWLDVLEGGWAVIVHTDNEPELAKALAAEMAEKAWSLRDRFWVSARVAPVGAVRQAVAATQGLVILSDTGDSVFGGAPGDSTCVLRALLEQPLDGPAYVPMVDAEAVNAAIAAGVGASLTIALGGKMDNIFSKPVTVTAKVAAISHGFTVDLHDRGIIDLSRTALLQTGSISIALLEHRCFAINHPVLYSHLGLEIADAKMVVVKTASNFQFFERWRKELIRVDSPGTTQSDLTAFQWKRVPRPIYPLDAGARLSVE
ncbi:MAG: M81 family metallopeptidase [Planctomycetes bacterium]|nr:M81 family metallopeptidase [Planctomycetota bacterium]